jgi:hypothetical protein
MTALDLLIILAAAVLSLWLLSAIIGAVSAFLAYRRIVKGWDREDREVAARVGRRVA